MVDKGTARAAASNRAKCVVPLAGAIDTHVHSSPDVTPRVLDDLGVVAAAARAGLRGIVLKSHHFATAPRAVLAQTQAAELSVFGGIVLNRSSCGGFNPDAVRVNLAVGGRIVWMPTISARNHLNYVAATNNPGHVGAIGAGLRETGLSPLMRDGRVDPVVGEILGVVAENDAVLATGHLSSEEICAVVGEARRRGVRRILITHPEAPQIRMPVGIQRELASPGTYFERCYYSLLAGYPTDAMLAEARAVGIESTIFATDLGQAHNPMPAEGFLQFYEALSTAGLSLEEWQRAVVSNPAALFSFSASPEA